MFKFAFVLLIFPNSALSKIIKQNNSIHLINNNLDKFQDWWESATFYHIYPRSFKDSNNDGIGDLKGITQKLDYLKEIGITAVWLSPIFQSPQIDQGYDISDYRTIDPDYGTIDDLKELLERAHSLRIKIILDFVPNHTSDQHEWFQYSTNRKEGYEDFYVWSDGKIDENGNRIPPNNWFSRYENYAWSWNEKRKQYFYYSFQPYQPDLNLRNKNVIKELDEILIFWLDFGIDGFRIDAAPSLLEDVHLRDEPKGNSTGYTSDDYNYYDHKYTKDLNESFELIYHWRELFDNYNLEKGGETRVMVTESYAPLELTFLYYGLPDGSRLGAHFSFNFDFVTKVKKNSAAADIFTVINNWISVKQSNRYTYLKFNWQFSNHDNHRVANRLGKENIDGCNMLLAILPDMQNTYYGEEIGQENGEVQCWEGKDPSAIQSCGTFELYSRDLVRTPFQWDNSINSGFNSGGKPWLPVSKKSNETNLAVQKETKSHYTIYKNLQELRQDFRRKSLQSFGAVLHSDSVIEIYRQSFGSNEPLFIVIVNFSGKIQIFSIQRSLDLMEIILTSSNSLRNKGDQIRMNFIELKPHESILLKSIKLRN